MNGHKRCHLKMLSAPKLALFGALSAAVMAAPGQLDAQEHEIELFRRSFHPGVLTIRAGDTIIWTWVAGEHVITSGESSDPEDSPGALFEARVDEANPAFSYRFDIPGEYSFFDALNEAAGGVGSITVQGDAKTEIVRVVDNVFIPEDIAIFAGDTIHWRHDPMEAEHTVTSGRSSAPEDNPGALFDEVSSDLIPNFFYTFEDPGFYPYFCRPHEHLDMVGSVRVQRSFIRGDFNLDSSPDVGDVVGVLIHVFIRTSETRCLDAGDTNDDGAVDLRDALHLLSHLFLDEVGIAAPYPGPGPDRSEDDLLCE